MLAGVLSLQGGVEEHVSIIQGLGFEAMEIKKAEQLEGVDALVLPGGESTTHYLLSRERGLLGEIKKAVRRGMPVFGTCAGAILLAGRVGKGNGLVGTMDIRLERNAYGRQLDSFEAGLDINGLKGKFPGVFIRAPVINSVGKSVQVLSRFNGKPVLARQGRMLAAAFHPELTEDSRLHKFFLGRVAQGL